MLFSNTDVSQGSSATPLRCGGIVNDGFLAYLLVNLPVKKIENLLTFGEVMDNIVVPYFLTHSVHRKKLLNSGVHKLAVNDIRMI